MLDYDILLLKAQKEYSTLPQHLIPYVNANLNVNSVKHNLYETDKGLKFIFQFEIKGGENINLEIVLNTLSITIKTNCYEYNTNKPSKWVALALTRVVEELKEKVLVKSTETIKKEIEKQQVSILIKELV